MQFHCKLSALKIVQVSATELVTKNPDLRFISIRTRLFDGSERDVLRGTDLVPMMAVEENAVPDHECIAAAIADDVGLQLLTFLRGQRRNERAKFRVDGQGRTHVLTVLSAGGSATLRPNRAGRSS